MNWRESWIVYWAKQLEYVTNEQEAILQKNFSEESLEFFIGQEKREKVRYLFIIQCILQSLSKVGYMDEASCNHFIKEKLVYVKDKQVFLSLDDIPVEKKILLEHVLKLEQKQIFTGQDIEFIAKLSDLIPSQKISSTENGSTLFEKKLLEQKEAHQSTMAFLFSHQDHEEKKKTFSTPFPNNQLENYHILEKIGEGGMGVVYRGIDTRTEKEVAIKAIKAQGGAKASSVKRFEREMELSALLDHPNLVKILSFGESHGHPYLIMEYVKGKPLLRYVSQKEDMIKEKLFIIKKVLHALEYAHKKNILHRDIKPSNILVKDDGEPILMDFGLAKSTEVTDKSLTQSGEVLGTPQYMAPEQAKGEKNKIDSQTDIYGVGAVLYHLLMGNPPAMGENLMDILHQVVKNPPYFPKEKNSPFPSSVKNICLKALEKKKKHRYGSAKAFSQDIQHYLKKQKVMANSHFFKKKIVMGLKLFIGVLLLLGIIMFSLTRGPSKQSLREQALQYYHEGKKENNLDFAYLKYSRALELITEEKHKNKNKKFIYTIANQLLKTKFAQGKENKNPQEALIFFDRGFELLTHLTRKKYLKKTRFWKRKFIKEILLNSFLIKDYVRAYRISMTLKNPDLRTQWITAVSSYYCEYEDAFFRMKSLQKNSTKGTEEYIGSLYFQGVILYKKKYYSKAKEVLLSAIQESKKEYFFSQTLLIYYLASCLINIDKIWTDKELEPLEHMLKKITSETLMKNFFYKEVLAKFYIARVRITRDKKLAEKVIELINSCIQYFPENSDYYYMRGKGYKFLEKFENAFADCKKSLALEPTQIRAMIESIRLLEYYPRIDKISTILDGLPISMKRSLYITINLFEKDFDELRKIYMRLRFQNTKGIAYSDKKFAYYYKNLTTPLKGIQNSMKITLAAMKPYKKTRQALLQKKKIAKEIYRKRIEDTIHTIDRNIKQEQMLRLFATLTQKSFLHSSRIQYYLKNIELLRSILHDFKGKLAPQSKETWNLMRFKAARAIVAIPEFRKETILLLESKQCDITTKILVAKALYDRGFVYFNKIFILEFLQKSKDTFLKSLAIGTLVPNMERVKNILLKILDDEDPRIRVLVASRFIHVFVNHKVSERVISILLAAQKSKNERIRAFSALYCWSNKFLSTHIHHFQGYYKKRFRYYTKLFDDSSELVHLAAFFHIKKLRVRKRIDIKTITRKVRRILHRNASPFSRYHSIVALGKLKDISTINSIALNRNMPLIERLASLAGFMTLSNKDLSLNFLLKTLKDNMRSEKNIKIKGFILYSISFMIANVYKREENPLLLSIFFGIMEKEWMRYLNSKSEFLKMVSILSFYNIPRVPDAFIKRLKEIADTSNNLNIKAAAFGALASSYHRANDKTALKKLHSWVKRKCTGHSQKARFYRQAITRGYYSAIKVNIEYIPDLSTVSLGQITDISNEQKDFRQKLLLKFYTRGKKNRIFYKKTFLRILDILFHIQKCTEKERLFLEEILEYIVILYDIDSEYTKAANILNRFFKKYGRSNPKLIAQSSYFLFCLGKKEKAIRILEKEKQRLRKKLPVAILRMLAKLYHRQKNKKQTEKFLYKQYYLAPQDPVSLLLLGHYYCDIKKYGRAREIFNEYINHYNYGNTKHAIGLVRVYCAMKDRRLALRYLRSSFLYGLLSPEDLKYEELAFIEKETLYIAVRNLVTGKAKSKMYRRRIERTKN